MRWLKLLNIFLIILIFPVSSFLLKDYLVYKTIPHEEITTKGAPDISHTLSNSLISYAPVAESRVFSPSNDKFIPIDMDETASLLPSVSKNEEVSSGLNNLYLRGTVLGSKGYAVFEDRAAKKEGIFKLNENVFESGILKKIEKESAVILRDGKEFPFVIITEDIQVLPLERQIQPQSFGASSPLSQKMGEREWMIDQRGVLKSLENMNQVLTDARLTPNIINGKVEGFRIGEIKTRGIFDAIGLKNGDILTRVNGYPIDSPEKAVQVISGLKGETSVNLDLIRENQRMSFLYRIR